MPYKVNVNNATNVYRDTIFELQETGIPLISVGDYNRGASLLPFILPSGQEAMVPSHTPTTIRGTSVDNAHSTLRASCDVVDHPKRNSDHYGLDVSTDEIVATYKLPTAREERYKKRYIQFQHSIQVGDFFKSATGKSYHKKQGCHNAYISISSARNLQPYYYCCK